MTAMARRKGVPIPQSEQTRAAISRGVKAHYEKHPRTDAHNQRIGEGVKKARARKQGS